MCCSFVFLFFLYLYFYTNTILKMETVKPKITNLINMEVLLMWVRYINFRLKLYVVVCCPQTNSHAFLQDLIHALFTENLFVFHNTRINFAHVNRHLFNSVFFLSLIYHIHHIFSLSYIVCLYYKKKEKKKSTSHSREG